VDNRKNNGGHSTKGFAGRPKKADELKLIEKLDALSKPKESVDISSSDGFNVNFKDLIKFK